MRNRACNAIVHAPNSGAPKIEKVFVGHSDATSAVEKRAWLLPQASSKPATSSASGVDSDSGATAEL